FIRSCRDARAAAASGSPSRRRSSRSTTGRSNAKVCQVAPYSRFCFRWNSTAPPRRVRRIGSPMQAYAQHPVPGELLKPVWIVDDDRSIRWVLEKALAREGIAYKTFASAREVLQALQQSQPQVLVSDIRMPGESGLTLLSNIKERFPQI